MRAILSSTGILAAVFAAGCTSSGSLDGVGAGIAPVDDSFTIALPDTVATLPYSWQAGELASVASETSQAGAPQAEVQLASLGAGAAATAAFAGPSPSSPASAIVNKRHDAAHIDSLIAKYATIYELPEEFVRRVVRRESTFNPMAYNKGHWGLMQIKHATARGMGYDGPAEGLLDPETNLKYAVKYLRGAYLVANGDTHRADRLYQRGYYYDAKRAGLLEATGLGRDRKRRRASGA